MIRSLSVLSAGVVALAVSGAANADNDLMRLDGKGDAEVQETRYGGGGFRGGAGFGGYRGFGGYGRGYGGGYYGRGIGYGGYGRGFGYGYGRGYYGGYYRPYYGFGYGLGLGLGYASYYGGYGGGYGYGGYGGGYGGYYGNSYSTPYYSSSYGLCPCATNTIIPSAASVNLVTPTAGNGTFPYDGGPQDGFLVPAPAGMPNHTNTPRDGLRVSVPASSSGYQFMAFGEQPAPADQRPATGDSSDLLRASYPAYGEAPRGFSGGTTIYPPMTR